MEGLQRVLRDHQFFAGIDPTIIEFLAGCAANRRFTPGDFLFREGEDANAMFLLRHGRVTLESHSPGYGTTSLMTLEAGDVFGWSWLFPPYLWRLDARAVEPVLALAFDGKCLRAKCEADNHVGYELLKRLLGETGRQIERAHLQLMDMYRLHP